MNSSSIGEWINVAVIIPSVYEDQFEHLLYQLSSSDVVYHHSAIYLSQEGMSEGEAVLFDAMWRDLGIELDVPIANDVVTSTIDRFIKYAEFVTEAAVEKNLFVPLELRSSHVLQELRTLINSDPLLCEHAQIAVLSDT
jgi:hypothetical protein